MKKVFASLLVCALLFLTIVSANAADIGDVYRETATYLQNCPTPSVGAIGGEWLIIGLARSGLLSKETAEGYYAHVKEYVAEKGAAKLDRNKVTENARVILALTAIGKNPEDVCGFNLLSPLADFSFVKKQGTNGPVWTLIALDSLQYEIPEAPQGKEATTREKLINLSLERQSETGCWRINDNSGDDPDMTGMALQALAPYYQSDNRVRQAIQRTLDSLSPQQHDDGSFLSVSSVSPECCAQMIVALTSLGIHPQQDARFLKNNVSVVDCMLGFYDKDGFVHEKDGEINQMSTEQAFYAMTAIRRFENSQTALYDMSDLLMPYDVNLDGQVDITDATLVQKYIAELAPLTRRQLKIAKADAEGKVYITFVTEIQHYIAS